MRALVGDSHVTLWASAHDTYEWAHRARDSWIGSELSGRRFAAMFDSAGLVELTVNGRDGVEVPERELSCCCADLLRDRLPTDHPCYLVAVGQFIDE